MRILVLGAGATGGYFGGRLAQAGAEVRFLVRPARAAKLAETGLVIESPDGDATLEVETVTADALEPGADDLVLLSCKAYDLDDAIAAIRPAMEGGARVLPILNGMAHLETLDEAFGRACVLGGLCRISAALGPAGQIRHLAYTPRIACGPRAEHQESICVALEAAFDGSGVGVEVRHDILMAMWEKWVMLATLAAATCLMRGPVGPIAAADGGRRTLLDLFEEVGRIAESEGFTLSGEVRGRIQQMLGDTQSQTAASMLRDIERGGPTEGEHVLGDLVRRAERLSLDTPLLRAAHVHLQVYEAGRG